MFGGRGPLFADDPLGRIESPLVVFQFGHSVQFLGEAAAGVLLLFTACGTPRATRQGVVHLMDATIESVHLGAQFLDLEPA